MRSGARFFVFRKKGAAALRQTRPPLRRKSSVLRETARCLSRKNAALRDVGAALGAKSSVSGGRGAAWESSAGTRGAIGADAAHHIAGGVHDEAVGERRDGNGHIGQAEGAVTTLANEVQVQIRRIVGGRFAAMAVVGAEGVLHLSRAVLDMVHQMVLGEGGEGAKHRAALHRAQPRFAVGERKGATCVEQRAQYQ